ncbi:leucine-rich repeat-containing protein 43-like [Piliocolobus tephrosceles]|uniref:leucine-rich repeat-containing protein 43-like n=1 Tax=Piliocolobus tephrosceles TaxID=591936 RepID=UPI0013018BE3|nr:leucine-rich repeat-containing protein 43-like [Piliocolobus tephrosceles]
MEASYQSESESEAWPGTQRPGTGTVSAAVREHLRKLCLREFPCGAGSWVRAPGLGLWGPGPAAGRHGPGRAGRAGPWGLGSVHSGGRQPFGVLKGAVSHLEKSPPLPLQNKSRFLPQTWRTWRELVTKEEDVVSPGEETVEALLGLVRSPHSPWALLNDSNAEDSFLRELAIRNPLMITDTFFYSYFRSLRVVDKEASAGHVGGHPGG